VALTVTAFETTNWTTTTTPLTISVTGALNGDKIVVIYGGDNGTGSGAVSAATVSTTGGTTSAWTEPQEGLAASNQAWLSSSVADVTADGTVTVSMARTQATGKLWGGMALLFRGHNGLGNSARSAPSAAETVNLTVSQGSAVAVLAIDWDALATVAFSPGGANEVERSQQGPGPDLTYYAGYWLNQSAGTTGYGIGTSSTTNLHIIAIEVLGSADSPSIPPQQWPALTGRLGGPWPRAQVGIPWPAAAVNDFAGDSALTVTDSITADGRTEGSATVSETATITTSGRAEGSSSLSETATITTSGRAQGTASVSETATVTTAERAEGSASLTVTATITAVGSLDSGSYSGSSTVTITDTITASGQAQGGSTLTVTDTITTSGRAEGSASISATATITASGEVRGSASIGVTATTSPQGEARGTSSLSVTASRSSSGNPTGTAAVTGTCTIGPSGRAEGSAALGIVFTIAIPSGAQPPIRVAVGEQVLLVDSSSAQTLQVTVGEQTMRVSTGHQQLQITTGTG
jgi:hypothetical protein